MGGYTITHTHPFNGPFSGTTRVSQYQKGKTNLDFTEARDSEWQWHQLGRMQVCTSLQTHNHTSTHHSVFTGRMPFLPPNQQRQSTEGGYTILVCNQPTRSTQQCIRPEVAKSNKISVRVKRGECQLWPQSQEGDWARPHLCKLARHGNGSSETMYDEGDGNLAVG